MFYTIKWYFICENKLNLYYWHDYCTHICMKKMAAILRPETRVVVFDLDGTLYAKHGMVRRMLLAAPLDWRKMLAERQTRKQLRGKWLRDEKTFYNSYFQTMALQCSSTPKEMGEWYEKRYMPLMVSVIQQYYTLAAWVKPFLVECRKRGMRLVVLSDYGHTHEKLEALGLDVELFDWVVSAPELGGLKPAAQLMQKVAERMTVSPSECLVIGDREDTDGEMAKAVGAAFYLVKQ